MDGTRQRNGSGGDRVMGTAAVQLAGLAGVFLSEDQWRHIHTALKLSRRESEIACGVLAARSEDQIAAELSISVHTVHSYLERLYRKLDVRSRCGLVTHLFATFVQLSGAGVIGTEPAVSASERK